MDGKTEPQQHRLPAPIRVDSSGEPITVPGNNGNNNGGATGTSWKNTKSFWRGPDLTEDHGRERWAYIMHAFARTPYAFAGVAFLPPLMTDLATLFAGDDGRITWMGFRLLPTSVASTYTTVAVLLASAANILLGPMTDFTPYRRGSMIFWNHLTCLCILLILSILLPVWWISTIIIIIIVISGEMAVLYVTAYLPEIALEESDRSRVSARAVIWGNAAQVTIAIIIALAIAYFTANEVEIDQASFEDGGDAWRLEWNGAVAAIGNVTAFTPFALPSSIVNNHADDGSHALSLSISSAMAAIAPVFLTQINTQPPAYYQDKSLLLTVFVEWCGSCTTPPVATTGAIAQIRVAYDNDPTHDCISDEFDLEDGVNRALRVTCVPPLDATAFQLQLKLPAAGQYWVDFWQAIPPIDTVRPLSLALTGIWYFLFSLLTFKYLPPRAASLHTKHGETKFGASMRQLWKSIRESRQYPGLMPFLIADMFWNDGLNAVLAVVAIFFQQELGVSSSTIGFALLFAQSMGIIGAPIFHVVGIRWGLKRSLLAILVTWTCFTPLAYVVLTKSTAYLMWPMCILLGSVFGALQSVSNAYYAGLMPLTRESEYSSLRSFADKITSWSGTLLFAAINEATGSLRLGILSLGIYFFIPLVIVWIWVPGHEPSTVSHRRAEKAGFSAMTPTRADGLASGHGNGMIHVAGSGAQPLIRAGGNSESQADGDTPSEATSRQDGGAPGGVAYIDHSGNAVMSLNLTPGHAMMARTISLKTASGSGTPTPQIGSQASSHAERTSVIVMGAAASTATAASATTLAMNAASAASSGGGSGGVSTASTPAGHSSPTLATPPISPPQNGALMSNGVPAFTPRSVHVQGFMASSTSPVPGTPPRGSPTPMTNGNGNPNSNTSNNNSSTDVLSSQYLLGAGSDSARHRGRSGSGGNALNVTGGRSGHSTRHSIAPSIGAFVSMPGNGLIPAPTSSNNNTINNMTSSSSMVMDPYTNNSNSSSSDNAPPPPAGSFVIVSPPRAVNDREREGLGSVSGASAARVTAGSPTIGFTRTQSSDDGATLINKPLPYLGRHMSTGSVGTDDDSRPATATGANGGSMGAGATLATQMDSHGLPIMTIEGPSSPTSPKSPTGRMPLARVPLLAPSQSNSPPTTADGTQPPSPNHASVSSTGATAGFLSPPLPMSLRPPIQPKLTPLSAGAHLSGTLSPLTSARSSGTFAFGALLAAASHNNGSRHRSSTTDSSGNVHSALGLGLSGGHRGSDININGNNSGSSTPHQQHNNGSLTPSSLRPTFATSRDPSPRYLLNRRGSANNDSTGNNELAAHIFRPRTHSSASAATGGAGIGMGLHMDDLRDGNSLNRPLDEESIDD